MKYLYFASIRYFLSLLYFCIPTWVSATMTNVTAATITAGPPVIPPFVAPPLDVPPLEPWSHHDEWRAAHILPRPQQVTWQALGFTAFVHFGMNTFTGKEWGTGEEDPALFNPTAFDAHQWTHTLAATGIKQLIFTAKHHDGFCLWPSRFTDHSVAHSPWKNGKGDVVREVSDACRSAGLKLGLYLSPADLHALFLKTYGKTEVKHRVIPTPVPGWTPKNSFRMEGDWDDYNTYFMNQLFELLTEYGPVSEMWFDGATPKNVGQVYAFADWKRLVYTLSPGIVLFGGDMDIRWIGNERGKTRANEWSVLPTKTPGKAREDNIGTRANLNNTQNWIWSPGETDVSIRPGWFYHANQDRSLHSLEALLDMWFGAVGGNAVLLLNVPPNKQGLFAPPDVQRLTELGNVLSATFSVNRARGARAKASTEIPGHEAGAALDNNPTTSWRPANWQRSATLEFTLPHPQLFSVIELQEDIAHFGQRVEKHAVDAWIDGQWKELVTWGTIGARRLHRVPAIETDRIRVRFLESRVCPTLAHFALYLEAPHGSAPVITRDAQGLVTITSSATKAIIRYTTDGSTPRRDSEIFKTPFSFLRGGVITACVDTTPADKSRSGLVTRVEFGPCKRAWKIVSVSSEDTSNAAASLCIDDNTATAWHSLVSELRTPLPHTVIIDMGEIYPVRAMTYVPCPQGPWVEHYIFKTSIDGKNWIDAGDGEFGNIINNPVLQIAPCSPRPARYLSFIATTEAKNRPQSGAAEIGILIQ